MEIERLPDDEYYCNRYVFTLKDKRRWELATHRVLFGWRVIIRAENSPFVEVNWCCGDNEELIRITFRLFAKLLQSGADPQEIPPVSYVKPWVKCHATVEKITALALNKMGSFPDITIFKTPNSPMNTHQFTVSSNQKSSNESAITNDVQ